MHKSPTQARLNSPDITEEEVAACMRDIAALAKSMAPWAREAEGLDDLMTQAQMMVKDRATQRTLHFTSVSISMKN